MREPDSARTLVTLATYNERENLGRLLDEVLATLDRVDVLVVDDASPDGTGDLADEYAAKDSRVHVLHRAGKLGLGTAHVAALQRAMADQYDNVVTMDADFSHAPKHLPELLAGMDGHDVMIGSRYVPGGGVVGWGWKRKFMSRAINIYSRLLLGIRARDCSGAYRCYRVSKLHDIDFDRIYSKGYSFQEEFLYHCMRAGCRIGETPIIFEDRVRGESKINRKEAIMALWALFYTAVRR